MARRTFFSFHYEADVSRAFVVRNSWVTKANQNSRESAGFFDSSVFEATKRTSDDSLKRFLREGLKNTSVTCVLVGAQTSLRRWVRYELFSSFVCGNGILAIRIHSIRSLGNQVSSAGGNPLDAIAFTLHGDEIQFREYTTSGWQSARDLSSMAVKDIRYDLGRRDNHTFSSMFPIYDWESDHGYRNLGAWVESAARFANR